MPRRRPTPEEPEKLNPGPELPEGERQEALGPLSRLLAYVHLADDDQWGLISEAPQEGGTEGDPRDEGSGEVPEDQDPGLACVRWGSPRDTASPSRR